MFPRRWRHFRKRVIARRGEFVPGGFGDGVGRGQRKPLEVQEFAAELDAKVEMRPGGQASHADESDALTLLDTLSVAHQNSR